MSLRNICISGLLCWFPHVESTRMPLRNAQFLRLHHFFNNNAFKSSAMATRTRLWVLPGRHQSFSATLAARPQVGCAALPHSTPLPRDLGHGPYRATHLSSPLPIDLLDSNEIPQRSAFSTIPDDHCPPAHPGQWPVTNISCYHGKHIPSFCCVHRIPATKGSQEIGLIGKVLVA